MAENNEKYILQSVANALDIIDILTEHEELSVPEVAKLSGLGKSSVFRLLTTLEYKHYVHKTDYAKYRLDIKLSGIGNKVLSRMEIIRYAHPRLLDLTRISGETSHLAVWDRGPNVRFVDKVLSVSSIHTDLLVGFCRQAHLFACGKVLLAYESQDFQKNYMTMANFSPLSKNSIVTEAQLYSELREIRKNGYGVDREESEPGLRCYSAPVKDLSGEVIAAISISGPSARMLENEKRNIAFVKQTAQDISDSMC